MSGGEEVRREQMKGCDAFSGLGIEKGGRKEERKEGGKEGG